MDKSSPVRHFIPVFSILDLKSKVFSPLFCENHRADAIRSFQQAVGDGKSKIGQYPSEFQLMSIGEFDICNGKLVCYDVPELVNRGSDFLTDDK